MPMPRALLPAVVAGCLIVLVLACFGPVLFQDRQFSYRDAGSFYYPLYQRVQQEWEAGRWPLWEPEENGGTPLLGNPSAAVLYPGKILYAFPFSYAWGARLYVVAHTLLAFAALLSLLRSWRVSWTGASLGAIAYAFGAPILFQYCNVIFLVGAAWAPLGLLAVDRLVRLGKRRAIVELAAVLALQVLGGDPQAAYLVLVCGGAYALGLARVQNRPVRTEPKARPAPSRRRALWAGLAIAMAAVAWVGGTLAAAAWLKTQRARLKDWSPFSYRPSYPLTLLAGWVVALILLGIAGRNRNRPGRRVLFRSLAALLGASALAAGLAAAQLLPVLEFSRLSVRLDEQARHDVYHFSVEPVRAVEWLWPGFFGTDLRGNRNWLRLVPPAYTASLWVPSCYLGGLTMLLAISAFGFRDGPPWRGWLSAIALGSFLGAIGPYGSPIWWARLLPGMETILGPHDPSVFEPPRGDGGVSDGVGGFYWLLATILPYFASFRYPGKLLIFTSLSLAALAGIGWDRLREGRVALGRGTPVVLLGVSLAALAAVSAARGPILRFFGPETERDLATYLGPFDSRAAFAELQRALAQGATVMALGLVLAFFARRKSRWVGPAALTVLALDLAGANAPLVVTIPQALFDRTPRLLHLIEQAERRDPSPGPFRFHRMLYWNPKSWHQTRAADRPRRVAEWQFDTVALKQALPYRYSYTLSHNTIELYDYWFSFSSFFVPLDTGRVELPGVRPGQPIAYHPRRGYDLWNTRYFILPLDPNGWDSDQRSFASFLADTELIAPDGRLFEAPEERANAQRWIENEDWQLRRNKVAYPRAWVVHQARRVGSGKDPGDQDRRRALQEILFANDPLWSDPDRPVFDPRSLAWIEADDNTWTSLAPFLPGSPPLPRETVSITRHEPQRVELEAHLERPGIVLLADVFYPGWTLTIDTEPATILRANGLMRGAAVKAGTHRLVYTYQPQSFRVGGFISLASLGLCLVLAVGARRGATRHEA